MRRLIAVVSCLLFASPFVLADDNARLVGTWRVVSFDLEFQNGDPSRPFLGQKWFGYTVFTAEGRTMSVWEAEGRKAAGNDEERVALLRTVHAITGTYRYENATGRVVIDVASNPAQRGVQTRGYQLDGTRLEVTTTWAPSPTLPGAPVTRSVVRFERVVK
jgi:Lipocalin-like domain